jgi:D-arabinose 1-dehydrogenase-like Zn-dependent alcohol dehydrogenase
MHALVVETFGGPLEARTVPVPAPGPGEVLMRVFACAVDHFDLRIRDGKVPHARVPVILGHELAGEVAALGPDVTGWAVGQRVTSTLYLTCGHCRQCQTGRETICENFKGYLGIQTPGGYAEYTTMPAANLVALPEGLDFARASVLANAVGTPYHALTKRMRLRVGERVIILGAGGGVGIHAVQLARLMGAQVLAVDIGEDKLSAAREYGAEVVVDAQAGDFAAAARDWTNGEGVEGILDLVGAATFETGLRALGKGGRLVIVGHHSGGNLALQSTQMIANEWEILGSRNVTKRELAEVAALVGAGRIRPVVTGVYPLAEAEAVHRKLRRGEVVGRVVLVPPGAAER